MDSLKNSNQIMISSTMEGEEGARATAHQLLGAVKAAGLISRAISAEGIRTLQAIRDEKVYLSLGCASFDEFLDKHPDSPMSYYQFHQREELLAKEGDLTFQLLNTLKVPASKRKLLKAGEVNVAGEEVEINGEKFPVKNAIDLRKLIVGILDEKAEVERREAAKDKVIERGKKEIERRKRNEAELEEKLSRGGFAVVDSAPHTRALVSVLGDCQLLAQEIERIDDVTEKERFRAVALEQLAEAKAQIDTAFGFTRPQSTLGLSDDDISDLAEN